MEPSSAVMQPFLLHCSQQIIPTYIGDIVTWWVHDYNDVNGAELACNGITIKNIGWGFLGGRRENTLDEYNNCFWYQTICMSLEREYKFLQDCVNGFT